MRVMSNWTTTEKDQISLGLCETMSNVLINEINVTSNMTIISIHSFRSKSTWALSLRPDDMTNKNVTSNMTIMNIATLQN